MTATLTSKQPNEVGTDRVHSQGAEASNTPNGARVAGWVAIAGVGLSIVGAILNQAVPSADVYAAMETSSATEQARLLVEVAADQTPLVAGFAVWMVGFPLVAVASILLSRLGRRSTITDLVPPLAIASIGATFVFLSMFITFVVVIAPAQVAGENVSTMARTVGFAATTIDWVITAIVLGMAPIAAVYAGRGSWAPRWLQGLAALTAVATIVELVGLAADARALTFFVVPVGLLLIASAGVVAIKSDRRAA